MKFHNVTLDNGLQVIAECHPEAHSLGLAFFVNTGARDETDAVWGVSHFLEHMAFKGTPRRSAFDVNREFDEIGSHPNAYTSDENTVYYAAVLPEYQEPALDILADILRPSLRQEDFDTEKQVILEEIQMYDDQPPFGADDKCKAAFFAGHPLARNVLGTLESVSGLTVDAMRGYFEERYSPRNITVVTGGRVDFSALVRGVEARCGGWRPHETQRRTAAPLAHRGFSTLNKPSATQQYTVSYAQGPGARDDDLYAAKLLAAVLGDDSGSRLFWELVDPGLADSAVLFHGGFQECGTFTTFMSCDPELAAENLQRICDLYRQAEREGISAAELQQAKNKVNAHLVLASERPLRRMFSIGSNWVQRGEYRTLREDLDLVKGITLDQVHQVLARYPLTAAHTVTIGPQADVPSPR